MDYEIKVGRREQEWVMRELEDYLAHAEIAGEGDLPAWVSF